VRLSLVHLSLALTLILPACAVDLGFEKRGGPSDSSSDPDGDEASADVPADDPDATSDPADGDGPSPTCGNGTLEEGEECDGDPARSCTTTCSSTGTQECVDCAWASCAPPEEVCNGVDDDCDDLTDEVVAITVSGGPVRISDAPGASQNASIDFDGDNFGIAWEDHRDGDSDIYSAIVSPTASILEAESLLVAGLTEARTPCLAWHLAAYRLLITDTGSGGTPDVVLVLMNPLGDRVGPPDLISNSPTETFADPVIAMSGGWSGLAWDSGSKIWFARLNPAGNKVGSDLRVEDDPGASHSADVASSGSHWGIAWVDERDGNREIYAAVVTDGSVSAADIRLTDDPADSGDPSIVWDGSTYAVAFSDERRGAGDVFIARFDSSGSEVGSEAAVTSGAVDARDPCIAWTGSGFGAAWIDDRGGETHVHTTLLDADGLALAPAEDVSGPGGNGADPDLSWSGSVLGITWQDDRHGDDEVFFAAVSFEGCP
jgi:hypothetical protein